jgi:hypothetical protein
MTNAEMTEKLILIFERLFDARFQMLNEPSVEYTVTYHKVCNEVISLLDREYK